MSSIKDVIMDDVQRIAEEKLGDLVMECWMVPAVATSSYDKAFVVNIKYGFFFKYTKSITFENYEYYDRREIQKMLPRPNDHLVSEIESLKKADAERGSSDIYRIPHDRWISFTTEENEDPVIGTVSRFTDPISKELKMAIIVTDGKSGCDFVNPNDIVSWEYHYPTIKELMDKLVK